MNFGFPYYYGDNIENPEHAGMDNPIGTIPPVLELPAHVAPLGMRFYTGSLFPEEYNNTIFIAEHGSWNRETPIGYQIVTVGPTEGTLEAVPFATGFLDSSGKVTGRPVDVEVLPDGSMLVSDDYAGKIYRITYEE
jgi:glucose/arabinose dehydrogenase